MSFVPSATPSENQMVHLLSKQIFPNIGDETKFESNGTFPLHLLIYVEQSF
ncbi:hypothetical protein ACHAXS_006711 [Conticribra weissflogii]